MIFNSFSSCENDEIGVNEIGYPNLVFPEPYTQWGGSVTDAFNHMSQYGLKTDGIEGSDAYFVDGHKEQKWFQFYYGANPYDKGDILYDYCFDNAASGLKAVLVMFTGTQIKADELTAQFNIAGYKYEGFINNEYHLYSNTTTVIKCYISANQIVYSKNGDADELIWF